MVSSARLGTALTAANLDTHQLADYAELRTLVAPDLRYSSSDLVDDMKRAPPVPMWRETTFSSISV